jgi:hypothetical protein
MEVVGVVYGGGDWGGVVGVKKTPSPLGSWVLSENQVGSPFSCFIEFVWDNFLDFKLG